MNKSYVEEIRLCFYISCRLIVILKKIITNQSTLVYYIEVGRPEGRRPLGRPRRRWEDIFLWK
jgi:hypothetical protein